MNCPPDHLPSPLLIHLEQRRTLPTPASLAVPRATPTYGAAATMGRCAAACRRPGPSICPSGNKYQARSLTCACLRPPCRQTYLFTITRSRNASSPAAQPVAPVLAPAPVGQTPPCFGSRLRPGGDGCCMHSPASAWRTSDWHAPASAFVQRSGRACRLPCEIQWKQSRPANRVRVATAAVSPRREPQEKAPFASVGGSESHAPSAGGLIDLENVRSCRHTRQCGEGASFSRAVHGPWGGGCSAAVCSWSEPLLSFQTTRQPKLSCDCSQVLRAPFGKQRCQLAKGCARTQEAMRGVGQPGRSAVRPCVNTA